MNNSSCLGEKMFVLSDHLIKYSSKYELNITELLFLTYYENDDTKEFDVTKLCEVLHVKETQIYEAFNHLLTLKLINLETRKDSNNRQSEVISLKPLYKEINEEKVNEEKSKSNETIYDIFQRELGRALSNIEYEIITGWLDKDYPEELIKGALKEAVYNGVNSLRYIDRILFEWEKKGYKKLEDVEKGLKKNDDRDLDLFDYDWLSDNEK